MVHRGLKALQSIEYEKYLRDASTFSVPIWQFELKVMYDSVL